VVSAYIDLNPVRAGLVWDPKDYRWCGYAEAVVGKKPAREGLQRVMFEKFSTLTSEERAAEQVVNWRTLGREYRKILFEDGRASPGEKEGGTRKTGVRTFTEAQVRKVLEAGGKLSEQEMLRCKTRHVVDGLVIGTKSFLNRVFKLSPPDYFPKTRRDGARKIRGVETELCTMRDLQREPLS
jgi:hypothetical protein